MIALSAILLISLAALGIAGGAHGAVMLDADRLCGGYW